MEVFIIFGLIILNGIFAMAEIALVSARKARLEAQANKGDAKAKEALQLANHPDKFISTVQIGITLIGILNGIFSGESIKGNLVNFLKQFEFIRHYSNYHYLFFTCSWRACSKTNWSQQSGSDRENPCCAHAVRYVYNLSFYLVTFNIK
jgi:CBS domain containing-hemolysin-like protein